MGIDQVQGAGRHVGQQISQDAKRLGETRKQGEQQSQGQEQVDQQGNGPPEQTPGSQILGALQQLGQVLNTNSQGAPTVLIGGSKGNAVDTLGYTDPTTPLTASQTQTVNSLGYTDPTTPLQA